MRPVLVAFTVAQTGCAMLASANAAHSRITPCIRDPKYTVVDFVIASGLAVALVGTEVALDNPWWFIAPGVFALSGTVGTIEVIRCRRRDEPTSQPSNDGSSGVYDETYPFPTAGSDSGSDSGSGSAEDTTVVPPPPGGPDLRLGSDYELREPIPADAGTEPATCSVSPVRNCPDGFSCRLETTHDGHCVRD